MDELLVGKDEVDEDDVDDVDDVVRGVLPVDVVVDDVEGFAFQAIDDDNGNDDGVDA